jgi:hypothetical protein
MEIVPLAGCPASVKVFVGLRELLPACTGRLVVPSGRGVDGNR